MLDTDNPIVQLCAAAEEQRVAGNLEGARGLLRQAWEDASTPWERAVAAHYVAGIQPMPAGSHHWHRTAMDEARLAEAEDPDSVRELWPSLHLAFAGSLEAVGSPERAAGEYRDALEAAVALGAAGEGYARAAEDGLRRVGADLPLTPLLVVRQDLARAAPSDFDQIEANLQSLLPNLSRRSMPPPDAFAGIELFLPTAVFLFLPAAYLTAIAQEVARDHYKALKPAARRATSALWRAFMSSMPTYRITVVATSPEKASASSQSLAFSIESVTAHGTPIKLVFPKLLDEGAFADAVLSFTAELVEQHAGRVSDLDELGTERPIGGKHLVRYDESSGKITQLSSREIRGRDG